MTIPDPEPEQEPVERPFQELRDSGLLWLINTSVLHPRGYALSLCFDGDDENLGECTGWILMGDGTERWAFDERNREFSKLLDETFLKLKELMP